MPSLNKIRQEVAVLCRRAEKAGGDIQAVLGRLYGKVRDGARDEDLHMLAALAVGLQSAAAQCAADTGVFHPLGRV